MLTEYGTMPYLIPSATTPNAKSPVFPSVVNKAAKHTSLCKAIREIMYSDNFYIKHSAENTQKNSYSYLVTTYKDVNIGELKKVETLGHLKVKWESY